MYKILHQGNGIFYQCKSQGSHKWARGGQQLLGLNNKFYLVYSRKLKKFGSFVHSVVLLNRKLYYLFILQVTVSPTRGTLFEVESITRITYTVEDRGNNTNQCTFTVEVRSKQSNNVHAYKRCCHCMCTLLTFDRRSTCTVRLEVPPGGLT